MDFDDSPQEAAFRAEVRAWLDANATPLAPGQRRKGFRELGEVSEALRLAKEWQAKKADAGWACITWPTEYGGRGASLIDSSIFSQEEGRYDVPPNMFSIGHGMLGPTLMAVGTEAQKQRYLQPMLRGEEVWSQIFSEPSAGSDLAGLRTTAVRDGDNWIVNGQKIWTSGAHYSDWGMILTRTDPTAAKHAGITYFIVDLKAPGVDIRAIKEISGGSNFNEIFFSDVRIPDANRIGEVNDGWRCAITTLMNERLSRSDQSGIGLDFDDVLDVARETEWNGRRALDADSVRQRIADYYVTIRGIENLNRRVQTDLSRGRPPGPESSVSKMVVSPLQQAIASFTVELQGEMGATMDEAITPFGAGCQRAWLSAPGMRLAGGTDEILHNIVAERVLGLPGEIRADKGLAFKDIPTGSR